MAKSFFTNHLGGIALATFLVVLALPAANAFGHATVLIDKTSNARAGQQGGFTLRIPHGCAGGAPTTNIVTMLSRSFTAVQPQAVPGWTSTVRHRRGQRWKIAWTTMGEGLPNAITGDFPLAVTWPDRAATYGAPTVQYCPGTRFDWTERYDGPAVVGQPSPPIFPMPSIAVKR
ncbi:MAG: DUF1775 domain-containing protein [Thermoleophilaceae bacterium]|nr:DUF1775 domain-containing protein [Thermoleophilaceae bacterium]